tara:strand:- start:1208 stop:1501 length:294 start_codon:yes stop_codon:yes gene_type:complete
MSRKKEYREVKVSSMKEYLLIAYNEGTSEIVDEYDLEEKVEEIRNCNDMAVATEILYGETIIDDAAVYFKKLNIQKKRAATIAKNKELANGKKSKEI